jgi:hypothetical protein
MLRLQARLDSHSLEDPCRVNRWMVDDLAREGIPFSRD